MNIMTNWIKFNNGHDLLDAKNVTLKDTTNGCILVDYESISIYRGSVENLNKSDDMGSLFLDSLNKKTASNKLVKDSDVKEALVKFNNLQCNVYKYMEVEILPRNLLCVMAVADNKFAEIGHCFQCLVEEGRVTFYDDLSRFYKIPNVIPIEQFKKGFIEISRNDYKKYINAVCEGEDEVINGIVRKYLN